MADITPIDNQINQVILNEIEQLLAENLELIELWLDQEKIFKLTLRRIGELFGINFTNETIDYALETHKNKVSVGN
jgi:hypothetical protein